MKRLLLGTTALILSCTVTMAQVTVDNTSNTVEQLIQDHLLGPGVTASGFMLNGGSAAVVDEQAGIFMDPTSSCGLPAGVIMGSGDVMMAQQPNVAGSSSLGGPGTSGADPDLNAITPNPVWDQCVIEFDFVPLGDTIQFQYVFASEEYPEYVCGNVNDAFGFFLTGANPAGGMYTAENIALIPDPTSPGSYTTTPVSINTLNPGVPGSTTGGDPTNCDAIDPLWSSYSVFYVDNTSGTDYEYDGRSVVLTAVAAVECGTSYHIKLAIGDGGDAAWDSGVFLEAGSFTSTGVSVTAASFDGDSLMTESCEDAMFVFCRPDTTSDFTIHFDVTGSATPGVDVTAFPDSITIPAGVTCDTLIIEAFEDGIPEPTEDLTVTITYDGGCTGPDTVEATLYIANRDPLEVSINDDQIICVENGEFGLLDGSYIGGFPPYTFLWADASDTTIVISTDTSTTVTPANPTSYMFYVTDGCLVTEAAGPIEIINQCDIEAPNVFSPNGDGVNETFYIINLEQYPNSRCEIYNRWGQLVYQNDNYLNDWDGRNQSGNEVSPGVYYFIVTPNTDDLEPVTGHVTVVR